MQAIISAIFSCTPWAIFNVYFGKYKYIYIYIYTYYSFIWIPSNGLSSYLPNDYCFKPVFALVSNTTMRLLNLTCTIRFIIRSRTISIKTISINWLTKNAQFSHKLSSDVISIMLWRILRDRRFVLRSTLLVLAEKTEIFLNQAREILICVEREWENNEHVMFSNNTCNFWYFTQASVI